MGGIGNIFKNIGHALGAADDWAYKTSPSGQSQQGLDIRKQQEQIAQEQEEREQRQSDLEFHQHMIQIGALPVVNGMVKRQVPAPDGNGGTMMSTLVDQPDPSRTTKPFKDATGDPISYELPPMHQQLANAFQAQHDPNLIAAQHQAEEQEAQHQAQLAQITRNASGIPLSQTFSPEMLDKLGIPRDTEIKLLPSELLNLTGKVAGPSIRADTQEDITGKKIEATATNTDKLIAARKAIADANRQAVQERQNNLLAWKTQDETRNQQLKDQISQRSAAVQAGMQPNLGAARLSAFQSHVDPLMQEADRRRQALSSIPDLLDETKTPNSTPDKPSVFQNPFTGGQMEMNPGVRLMLASQAKSETERIDELHHAAAHAAGVPELAQPAPQPAAQSGKPQAQANPNVDHTYDSVPADIRPTVAAITEGRTPGFTGRAATSGRGGRIMNSVYAFDPDWSSQRAEIRKSFALDKNIGANNTAAVHLDQLGDAAAALGNSSFRPGNAIYQAIQNTFGSSAPTNFEGIKAAVAGEMASALKGNATDPEIASMKANIDKSSSPEQLKGIIDENLKILAVKLNTYQERYSQQIPNDKKWSPVLPTAKAVFAKHGINPTAPPQDAGGQQPAQNAPQYKAGDKRTINGTTYVRDEKGTWSPQ